MSEQLPQGWRRVSLSEVTSSCLGKMLDRQKHKSGKALPYLRNQNVRWFSVDDSDLLEMYFEDGELERYGLRQGDVLICEGGEPGRAAIWDGRTSDMKFQKALHRVRPHATLLPEWLVYRLWHDAQAGRLSSYFTGTTIKHFTGTSLARYELPLPPLNEQRRIVAKLEALQARSRRAREALGAVPPLLEKLRQSILAAAFRGDLTKDWRAKNKDVEPASKLLERMRTERRKKWEQAELAKMKAKGKPPTDDKWKAKYKEPAPVETGGLAELPDGWCWVSIETAGDVLLGRRRAAQEYVAGQDGRVMRPYVRVANVKEDRLELTDVLEMPFNDVELSLYRLLPGDIILSEGQSPELVGQSAVFEGGVEDLCIQATVHRFRAYLSGTTSAFAQLVFLSHLHSGVFMRASSLTTNIAHLTSERLKPLPFPLPPIAEQSEIVRRVREVLERTNSVATLVKQLRAEERTLSAATLAKAFRGELVPQDMGDEAAAPKPSTNGSGASGLRRERAREPKVSHVV
ncbi:MAG: restriction endonuclease subunit S [Labilithrix sp.]|nr:restriction endonuclease subunit S [Labilithrix sp.]